jgi:hypothetical protein
LIVDRVFRLGEAEHHEVAVIAAEYVSGDARDHQVRSASRVKFHSTGHYKPAFEEGRADLELADSLDALAGTILDNLDTFAESLKPT